MQKLLIKLNLFKMFIIPSPCLNLIFFFFFFFFSECEVETFEKVKKTNVKNTGKFITYSIMYFIVHTHTHTHTHN